MPRLPRTFPSSLAFGLVVGVALAFGDLWHDCRRPDSEACVWGRAYLPLSLGLGAAFGAFLGFVLSVVRRDD